MKKNIEDEKYIEIYRQRYETFRHLDKLRWQILQIFVAVCTAFTILYKSKTGTIEPFYFLIFGIIIIFLSYFMFKIGEGIIKNNFVLEKVGEKIGDTDIPISKNIWEASSHKFALSVFLFGFIISISSILKMTGFA